MKNKLFSIFLIFSLIFSSVVHANTIAYDTSMKIGNSWKVARTFIKNNPLGKSPQGFILAVSSVYVGDKLVTEYQNGTFDAPMASMKKSIAEMFVMGVSASGWLKEQFDSLSKKFNCVSGSCTKEVDIYSSFFEGVYFKTQNGFIRYASVDQVVKAEVFNQGHLSYSIIGFLEGQNALQNLLSSNFKGGSLTLSVHLKCRIDGTWCGADNGVPKSEIIVNRTIVIEKPESKPVPIPTTGNVQTSEIAETLSEPATEQQQVEVISTCFLTNCSSIPSTRSEPQSIPSSYLPNGQSTDQKYPSPPLVLNPDGSVTDGTGSNVAEGTGQSDSSVGEKPSSIPEFCKWAKPVCDLKDWFTTDNIPEPEKTNIQDFDSSKAPEAKVWSVGNKQCPPSPTFNLGLFGNFTLEITPFCDFLSSIRSFVIASAYLGAAFIVFNYRRS